METSYTSIRGLVWAIPILGFIGTVSGLSYAIGGFGRVLSQTDDPSQLIEALKGVTGGLATAFETTLLALVAALLVQMAITFQKKREEEFTKPEKVKAYKPVPLHKVTSRPKFTRGVCKPEPYPPKAKKLGIEGRVEIEVELRHDGTVGDAIVISGLGYDIDAAAIEAIRKCPFEPGSISGKPVTTRITVGITFIIED